ncbi:MAG: protein kinase [Desulfobacterales bacterium]|nr:protein kinase [Desulfobacterales bacterium]
MTSQGAQIARLLDPANITGIPSYDLFKPVVRIGRSMTNDYIIKQKTVSGKHATIERRENGYVLIDLNSTNKTKVNGKEIKPNVPYMLEDEDEIHFDRYRFIFSHDETVQQAAPVSDGSGTIDIGTKSKWTPETAPHRPAEPAEPMHSGTIDIGSRPPSGQTDRTEPSVPEEASKIGTYEVDTLLGRGGFGSVWKCTDSAGNPVAVKLLNPDALENERAVRKFFHEAIILSKMNHPNICRFIDFFPHGENYAIVMDFVTGTDLKEMLKEQEGTFPFDMACRIASQTLDAFHYAHQQQVMHRDIKPENIILDLNNQVRIMDFGIAKLSSSETQHTSAYMISPAYTAPERFDVNQTVDYPSDIYSLGLAFYELFAGTHPFKVSSPAEMIFAHLNTLPKAPCEIVDIPEAISDAILKALEKDAKDRFKSFDEFKTAMFGKSDKEVKEEEPQLGVIACSEEFYGIGATLLRMYADVLRKYQKQAKSFRLIQEGSRLELIIEPHQGRPMRISKDLTKLISEGK